MLRVVKSAPPLHLLGVGLGPDNFSVYDVMQTGTFEVQASSDAG